ncbi:unnamed protein product [Diamesa serratosioi]
MANNKDTSFIDATKLRVKKMSKSERAISGIIEFKVNVGNEYEYVTYILKKTENDYKKMPYRLGPFKFCSNVNDDKYLFGDIRNVSNIPAKGVCPWPKVLY